MSELKISAKIPAGQHHIATAESKVAFTPTTILARGDTDAVRLVVVKVAGIEVLAPKPTLSLLRIDWPYGINSSVPVGPGRMVEIVLVSDRDTPAEVELILSDEV